MARPFPTCLMFTPTPLDVAKSSLVALIIFNVFNYQDPALLHTLKITTILVGLIGPDSLIGLNGLIGPAPSASLALLAGDGLFSLVGLIGLAPLASRVINLVGQ
jgi:hypothetical protein